VLDIDQGNGIMVEQTMGDPRASLRIQPEYQQLLDDSLAKPARDWRTGKPTQRQSYFEHVTDVYRVWSQLIELHRHAIERVATRACIPTERLLKSSLLCVALHDVGKLTGNFLDMMEATSKSAYRAAQRRTYRHEVAALPLVAACAKELGDREGCIPGNGHLEVLAVAGHHRFLADGYLFTQERFSNRITWKPDVATAIQAAVLLAQRMFRVHGWRLPNVNIALTELLHDETNFPFQQLSTSRNSVYEYSDKRQFRDVFSVLKGLLMISDWRASAAIERCGMLNAKAGCVDVPSGSLKSFVSLKVESQGRPFADYRNFQKECGGAPSRVLAIAPTGSGKTEAAFLWALNQIEQGHARKVLFLLPTMITANSLHARAVDFFDKEHNHKVGLIHSTADLVRQDTDINADHEIDNAHLQCDILAERHFLRPVTVGTVDQLLNTLFHSGRWAMKTFAAMDAAIVIDEVHAYDPHTAGLISLMLEQLSLAGSRFMVMSATMPTDLKKGYPFTV
jgi:CRISPR-associated endonuclease/helicase Cas3